MSRIKIELPPTFLFTCEIPIRITDVNYGGHVGNDTVLSLIHEARMLFLAEWGFTEMKFGSAGMIMANVAIEFKNEIFYGDKILASVQPVEISRAGFGLVYKFEIMREPHNQNKLSVAVLAKTGMVCYDYNKKKIVSMPDVKGWVQN